jgi:hypothetical protein
MRARLPVHLVVENPVCLYHFRIQEFHAGQLDVFAFIHPVDAQALPSGYQHALAQGEQLRLFGDRE